MRTFCLYEVTYLNILLSTLMLAYLIITTQFLVGSSMVDILFLSSIFNYLNLYVFNFSLINNILCVFYQFYLEKKLYFNWNIYFKILEKQRRHLTFIEHLGLDSILYILLLSSHKDSILYCLYSTSE